VLGAIELTWAASGLLGVPVAGVLLESLGWRAPFLGLAVAALTCAGLTLVLDETPLAARARAEPLRLGSILSHRSAIAFLLTSLPLFFAFENIQVGYASWFESRFGLDPGQRGTLQSLFGVFEIAASSSVSLFLDRIGKKRGVAGGLGVALLGYVLLASVGPLALPLGLVAMSVAFLGFEFGVVASIPLASEQMPQARGAMLALTVMSSGLGRLLGGVSGSALLAGPGFAFAALVSAGVAVMTLAVFALGVREHHA
jgi:predicted MFS family arabinose efflux permease